MLSEKSIQIFHFINLNMWVLDLIQSDMALYVSSFQF